MIMRDLMKMFPDATTRQGRKKPEIDNTPDDPDFSLQVAVQSAILVVVVFAVSAIGIAVLCYLGQKYNW
jgi:hypothetical protein